ncbi:MAG: alpha-glucosidase C-terminal domain-containing protein, partial [Bacteroidetes bacterium]|nr:alpha-glucosidase C-terminal domain-containing protein [Bacteroidota bacterium]
RSLRNFYRQLLRLCIENEALAQGNLLDLHEYNRKQGSKGYTDKVYAYLRFTPGMAVLVVVNFDDRRASCSIQIPDDALTLSGLVPDQDYRFKDLLMTDSEYSLKDGKVEIQLEPLGAYIFQIDKI